MDAGRRASQVAVGEARAEMQNKTAHLLCTVTDLNILHQEYISPLLIATTAFPFTEEALRHGNRSYPSSTLSSA